MKNSFDLGIVKTQKIYSFSYKSQAYCVKEVPKLGEDEPEIRIICTGKMFPKSQHFPMTLSDFKKDAEVIQDTSFFENMLRAGNQLLHKDGSRRSTSLSSEYCQKIVLEIVKIYGLNRFKFYKDTQEIGCNYFELAEGLQDLAIFYNRLYNRQMIKNVPFVGKNSFVAMSCGQVEANLYSFCLYDDKQDKIETVLVADSLVDIAMYQLGVVISSGIYTHKCDNPNCPNVIVGGRSDRKTCSDSCRKALERINKSCLRGSGNGQHQEN